MNHVFLPCVFQQSYIENGWRIADRRKFVRIGRMRQEAAFRVPLKFLGGQPAHALNKAAFDLAAINPWVNRIADVMHDVSPEDAVHAGETIHFDLGDRGSIRKIMERFATAEQTIPVDTRRAIITGC